MERTGLHYRIRESRGEGRPGTTYSTRDVNPWRIYLFLWIGICGILVFTRSAATVVPINPPILVTESTSTRAIAFESIVFMREPFGLRSRYAGATDQRTRVMVFAMNLALQSGEDLSVVSADAEDAAHRHYPLIIESIQPVPSCEWMSAVVFRLNDELGDVGDVLISVSYRSVMSNRVRIGIGHVGGGPPDDPGAVPTLVPPYTLSGRLTGNDGPALSGMSITLGGAQPETLVTGDGGLYSFTVNKVGDYTLTPASTPYYTFVPQSFTNLHLNQTANFVGTRRTFRISGTLRDQDGSGLAGLTVNLTGAEQGTTVSDNTGQYQFTNLSAGHDYTVAPPTTAAYTFTPWSLSDLTSNQTVNFTGVRRLNLYGTVRDQFGIGIFGIAVGLTGSQSVTTITGADGSYSLIPTATGNYTVTPSIPQAYYTFAPASERFTNLDRAHMTDFTATFAPLPDPSFVLEFDGQPKTVDYGNFWPEDVNLGHFFWEFWAMPGSNAGATYMLSDGYGGAHALLFGVAGLGSAEPNRYLLLGDIFDGVNPTLYFASDQGPAIGEWAHFAVGWDGQNIITYYNGVPVGKTPFHGPRRTPGYSGGGGRLLIGGSDHSNFDGRIAQVRGYEDTNPREALPGGVEASFAPQTVFGREGSLLSYYFRSGGTTVADLSRGYTGVSHSGRLRGTVAGILFDCGDCPPPQFVIDPSAPKFNTNTPPAPVAVPSPAAAPGTALVFDSFSRVNSTRLFGSRGGLGSTEGGSAGIEVWQTNQPPTSPQPFGILNAIGVVLANETAVAWVQTASPNGGVDIRVDRRRGTFGSGIHTGLSFRVVDANNFFFAYTTDDGSSSNTQILKVGYYLSGQRVDLATSSALPADWITLRVVTTNVGEVRVYVGSTLAYTTSNHLMETATGAGLYNNSSGLGLVNRWDNFTVFNAP